MTFTRSLVEAGDGIWVGTMKCPKSLTGQPGYTLVLFNSPKTGSTLALKSSEILTDITTAPERIRKHIADSDAKFATQRSTILSVQEKNQ